MRIDAAYFGPPQGAATAAQAARRANLNGLWVPETGHDPMLSCLLANQAEPELEIGTAIAVAFARSPMTLAQTAWDLAGLSQGKFHLGLGSQIKAHITRRFSMPWGKPVEQMREYILALRAIWASFDSGQKLNVSGEHYQLNLLTPFFTPAKHEYPCIPVGLAAVGPKMTELAGELADFIVYHTFTNIPYLKSVTVPALQAGLAKAGRKQEQLQRVGALFVITGDAARQRKMEMAVRGQIAFYASTPAYQPVLEAIGQGQLHPQMHEMSRQGKWAEMAMALPTEVVQAFSLRAEPCELKAAIEERFGDVYDRVLVHMSPEDLVALGQ
jgi:probable F420-dependent oxidoreductase